MKANRSVDLTNYLDLTFTVGINNGLCTKLKHKCDDLNLHISQFSILSLIPSGPSHSVYTLWCIIVDKIMPIDLKEGQQVTYSCVMRSFVE